MRVFWDNMHPGVKILTLLINIIIIVKMKTISGFLIMICLYGVIAILSKMDYHMLKKAIIGVLPFMLLSVIFASIGKENASFYLFNIIPIDTDGLILGLQIAVRMLLIIIVVLILTMTSSSSDLNYGIAVLLKPFSRLKLPVDELALILSMSMRFIPLLRDESQRVYRAQIARGAYWNEENIFIKIWNTFYIIVPVLLNSLKRADEIAMAMESRCYNGVNSYFNVSEYTFGKSEITVLSISVILLIFTLLRL